MKTDNVFLVLCGTLLLVILINARAIILLLRAGSARDYRNIGKTIQVTKKPWAEDDQAIRELRHRVDKLQKEHDEEDPTDLG